MFVRFRDPAVLESILAHARDGAPDEICGILAGRDEAGVRDVVRAYPVRNVHERPRGEYLIDPAEQLRITLEIEDDLGLDVVGFYHSHPAGPPRLSATDKARASWPNVTYFLAWLRPSEDVGAWLFDADRRLFIPQEVVIGDEDPLSGMKSEGAFLVDTDREVVHRLDGVTAACVINGIPEEARQFAANEARATMVLKTRHYSACDHCYRYERQRPAD